MIVWRVSPLLSSYDAAWPQEEGETVGYSRVACVMMPVCYMICRSVEHLLFFFRDTAAIRQIDI
jgi:hypothetical protein